MEIDEGLGRAFGTRRSNDRIGRPLSQVIEMFGYGAEGLLNKRRRERWEAQKTWPFLTEHDLRTIRSSSDLTALVAVHKDIPNEAAGKLVEEWMQAHFKRLAATETSDQRLGLHAPDIATYARPDW